MNNLIAELKRLNAAEENARDEFNDYTEKYQQPNYSWDVEEQLSYKKEEATEAHKSFLYNHADEIIKAMENGEKYERAYFRLEKRERDE